MKIRRLLWAIVGVLLVLIGSVAWYFTLGPGDATPWLIQVGWMEDPDAPLTATGLLEAVQVSVSSELSGRVKTVYVGEGDAIEAGDLLLTLDSTLLEAQLSETEAGIAVAQAALAQVEAGARIEQVQQAEAMLAQAIAARDGAYQALLDVQAIRANPQELNDQIDQARTQVEVASHLVMQAVATKDAVELLKNNVDWMFGWLGSGVTIPVPMPDGSTNNIHISGVDTSGVKTALKYQWWYAWTLINTAGAGRDGAQNALNELLRIRDNPHGLDARVAEARGRYESALAMVAMAQANLDAVQAGATEEQVEAVRARIKEAEAARALVQAQLEKTLIYAPIRGIVVELPLSVGESAQPGTRLAVIADLDVIQLNVYIPEDKLGRVSVGQKASVSVDTFPDRSFEGIVKHIASEAEYMPGGIQSKEGRVNMVFAARIELANSDRLLKPGMPADASFEQRDGSD